VPDRYPLVRNGEPVRVRSNAKTRIVCCDCGLVHDVALTARRGWVTYRFWRNVKATLAWRRLKRK